MRRINNPFGNFKNSIAKEVFGFFEFFLYYIKAKIISFSIMFEKNKNRLVKLFLMKRGRYNRPFLHLTTMGILGIGVLIAPFLSDTFPIFSQQASALDLTNAENEKQSVLVGEDVFETKISEKPRDKILEYTVQKGDTISTIARKYGISENTVRWANNLSNDNVSIGDTLKILPVTGVAHKVEVGDTVYTISKKYNTEAQKLVDFPFNEFANPETFALVTGQMLIVPDGIKPSEQPRYVRPQTYIAQGPVPVAGGGYTWPVRGGVSQYFSWYHPGLDITSPIGTPIYAAHNGTVTRVSIGTWNGGFGTDLYISNGAGMESHYAHLSGVNVSVGQRVVGGRTVVGWIGMTGRTTGPHIHFEMRSGGSPVNPLGYMR
jgi:murein DD-endopeptidase MepM/ murein hydrolase activator NlpD